MQATASTPLPISHGHAAAVAPLPQRHRDPFEGLLIVQTVADGLEIVTSDSAFDAYEVPVRRAV